MDNTRNDLKDRFEDGKIPRGSDFAEMIEAFALESELRSHVEDFTAFLPDGHSVIVLKNDRDPANPVTWSIGAQNTGELLITQSSASARQLEPTVEFDGWTGMQGRFGLWKSGEEKSDEEEDKTLGEPHHSMSFVDADGSWKTIIPVQPRTYSAEIVAYADGVPTPRPATTWFDDLIWPTRPVEAVCHAVVTCREKGTKPSVRFMGDPYVPVWLHSWWLLFYPWPLFFLLLGIAFVIATTLVPNSVFFPILALISFLLSLRQYRVWSNRRRGFRLRWHRVSGVAWNTDATHALEIRAGPFANKPKPRIRYHITRLWGL